MIRVLFVDDEKAVLTGLENRLRAQRKTWRMRFALGGRAAVDALEAEPVDVLVTDIRMPDLDGVQLLRLARERYPSVVRLALSGQTDQESLLRTLPLAHQFLAKPVDHELLRGTVERACTLQLLLGHDAVLDALGRLQRLPVSTAIYDELTRAIEAGASAAEVASLVGREVSLSARVLQLVNSAFFGLSRQLTDVQHAVAYLGLNAVRSVVLCEELFTALGRHPTPQGFSLEKLRRHSLLTARLAVPLLAEEADKQLALSAALLHDFGTLVLATALPDAFRATRALAAAEGRSHQEAERRLLGVTHAEIGAQLLSQWGLPYALVEIAAHHHQPSRAHRSGFDPLLAVHLADRLAHQLAHGQRPTLDATTEGLDVAALRAAPALDVPGVLAAAAAVGDQASGSGGLS